MFLEKLEIQGFKSFAFKTHLIFPGKINKDRFGITAIVGPNGSGKSNIADAIRWVMGEQSLKILRGKKSEDVIFSGSEKHGKLGMAEVSLYLNNDDKKIPGIEYSQIVITRRIYRDGLGEYILNGNRVRLADIEMLLAKARFGKNTYSVIGQGVVENFLNTSLTERKEFFDEATGVKEFQIKRDESLNKLKLSLENLKQAQMLLLEIEPRLKILTRQINKLKKKQEIEEELRTLQLNYYSKIWHDIKNKFNEVNDKFLEVEKIRIEKEKKINILNKELSLIEKENSLDQEFDNYQQELILWQNKRNDIIEKKTKLLVRLEIKLESGGNFDLTWLNSKKNNLSNELKETEEEIRILEKKTAEIINKYQKLSEEKNILNKKISDLNYNLIKLSSPTTNSEIEKIIKELKKFFEKLKKIELENDLNKIKESIKEIKEGISYIFQKVNRQVIEVETKNFHEELKFSIKHQEEIVAKINEASALNASLVERRKILGEKKDSLEKEIEEINSKISFYQNKEKTKEIENQENQFKKELEKIDLKISSIKEKINQYANSEKQKRDKIFELQHRFNLLQTEINNLNISLNEYKINATRYETRLEDLEKEIRSEFGSLKEIENNKVFSLVEEEARIKINNLKKQLEMIGALDPETEKEYLETKTKFNFLSEQINDLTTTVNSLEKIIKELDFVIKERFDKEFNLIQEKFQKYFSILFGGGNAKIIKVTTDDLLNNKEKKIENKNIKEILEINENEKNLDSSPSNYQFFTEEIYKKIKILQKYNATGLAGIEIQATPPGKKIKSLSLLSGGERALTAIALICAIIAANPAPFVMLDEVDAALDEANSERLAKIIDDLASKTQFIVITHNRASMRRANILYGVTMSDEGISKLISVKLEDVKAKNEN